MAAPAPFMRNPSTRRSRRSRTDQEHDDHENREYGNDWNGDLRLYQRPSDEADTEYERPESGVQPELRYPGESDENAGGKPDADDVYLRSEERPSGTSNLRQRSVYGVRIRQPGTCEPDQHVGRRYVHVPVHRRRPAV